MSFWGEGENLTLEKFREMAEKLPPLPEWIGFTVNSAMYRRLLSEDRFTADELEFGRAWTREMLFEVPNQTGEIVGWSNRADLNLYLEMMGARSSAQVEKQNALYLISERTGEPISRVVMELMHLPEDHLRHALQLMTPVVREAEIAVESLTANLEKIRAACEVKPEKNRRGANQPFYSKFVKEKRR